MKPADEKPKLSSRKRARAPLAAKASPSKVRTSAAADSPLPEPAGHHHWTFLSNHSHVLILLAKNSSLVLREVAWQVGITERAVQRIIADLEAGGIIERLKVGRQNHYHIQMDKPLRHPVESHRTIGQLLALINDDEADS